MSQILGVKFTDYGQIYYFSSGPYVVEKGQSVIVKTDQGMGLGRVVSVSSTPPEAAAGPGPEAAVEAAREAAPEQAPEPGTALEVPSRIVPDFLSETLVAEPSQDEALVAEPPQDEAVVVPPRDEAVVVPPRDEAVAEPQPQQKARPAGQRGEHKTIYRLANDKDLEASRENEKLAGEAFAFCRRCIQRLNLEMKLVDVEVNFDRSKMIFYFTAPGRIDFRELIKDLVREYHTRIELRQIGVRHETQMLGAIGNCGQICCCRRFLRKFVPVTIKMAKEQNLFLNPAKISGICGRLLCCLSYEQQGYEEFHKHCPRIGKRFQTSLGQVKVLRSNFFRKTLTLLVEGVGEREVSLEEWQEIVNQPPAEPAGGPAPERPERRERHERPSRGRPPPPPEPTFAPEPPAAPPEREPPQEEPPQAPEPQPAALAESPAAEPASTGPAQAGPAQAKPKQKNKRRRRKGKPQKSGRPQADDASGPKE